MKNIDNIDKLFKEKFEHFESNVSPQVWSNIQSGIKPISNSVGSGTYKLSAGKIVAGFASLAIISGSIWYFTSKSNLDSIPTKQQIKTETIDNPQVIKQDIIAKEKLATSSESLDNTNTSNLTHNQTPPPAIRSLNHYSSEYTQQTQIISKESSSKTPNENSITENPEKASSQPPTHKYGKGSEGPTSLIRGNLKVKSSKKNTPEDNQEVEQALNANILASSESGDAPLNVNFSNEGIASSLSWDFGDGSTSKENTPSHIFQKRRRNMGYACRNAY